MVGGASGPARTSEMSSIILSAAWRTYLPLVIYAKLALIAAVDDATEPHR